MTSKLSFLYTTFPNEEEALQIAQQLLEEHLIACANVLGGIKSLYFWEERLEISEEIAVLLKTTQEKVPTVIKTLQDLHSYETPAILEIPVERVAEPFRKWIQDSVR